ncbi:DUF2463 domain-containing protein [Encephalitozoon hellem]|uniref:DUF2463 domain-containing protein n=1 Tax=Encephalitozoon hellem TaxID=27973 RepID=A0ABY8CKR4_ENCHE|nr:DUF2463 domain-containing protein [Encephalitozoon hellem]
MNTNTHHTQHSLNQPTQQTPLLKRSLPTISIISPIIVCLLLESYSIPYSTPLKLIIPLPPFLYSGIQYLIIFNNNRREQSVSPSTLSSALHSLTNISLLLFSLISLLSIIALTIDIRDGDSKAFLLFIIMYPFLVSSTYMLSTSCTLTQSNFQYTTTNTADILLDLLILLSILASIVGIDLNINVQALLFCSIIVPAILIFIRSWRERCLQSTKHEESVAVWRVAILIIIFLIAIIIYSFLAYMLLLIFKEKLKSPEYY